MSTSDAGMAVPTLGDDQEGPRPESAWGESDRDQGASWPDQYDYDNFAVEYGARYYSPYSEEEPVDEGAEEQAYFPLFYYPAEERGESEVEKFLYRVPSTIRRDTVGPAPSFHDPRRKSLFVHSSPTHFPDISQARKSAFGSIFLRTTGNVMEDSALLRSVTDSSYSMLHSLLNSFEKIISSASSESDRKHMALAYKQSLLKALEAHGISRSYSDGSIHWNVYPIAHDYLFSVQMGENLHQTRLLSRIEDRILMGSMQRTRIPYAWPTDSVWTGHWDAVGMAGVGTYIMPHGVSFNGKLRNGMFHDDNATLTYPSKFKALHCVFNNGKLESCQFQFPDLLMHEQENWGYCLAPDRRFWSEVRNGLKPAKIAQKTEIDPPVKIPKGCYDTSDGFYDPKSLMLTGPGGELLRVPVCEEDIWIKKYCRKGFSEPTDFRPDLFENWYNYDQNLIQSILDAQANYRAGKITYDELQQYYADLNLMPSWSTYKRRKTPSEIALEEYLNSIPEPVPLRPPRKVEKFQGHALSPSVRAACADFSKEKFLSTQPSRLGVMKPSKSLLRFNTESRQKLLSNQGLPNAKASRISFRYNEEPTKSRSEINEKPISDICRKIPEKYLKYQPILKPPFASRSERQSVPSAEEDKKKKKKKCPKTSSSGELLSPWDADEEYFGEDYDSLRRRELRRFMKTIIMERVSDILKRERERHRQRLLWARKAPAKPLQRERSVADCLKVLGELFDSIPDKEEFCDSDPHRTCDLKQLAEDKYQMLHYWGKKLYLLDFKEVS